LKITCLTENLASGGAQRQLCSLAVLLKTRGWDVSVLTYFPQNFFQSYLIDNGVSHLEFDGCNRLSRIFEIRRILRNSDHDVVLSFLRTPNILAEISSFPGRKWGLVVSERTGWPNGQETRESWRTWFHYLADYVVVNSNKNRGILTFQAPWLIKKVRTIYNSVDLERFKPDSSGNQEDDVIRLLVVGRVSAEKNVFGLMRAFRKVVDCFPGKDIQLDWYGDSFKETGAGVQGPDGLFVRALKMRAALGLEKRFHFFPPTVDIAAKYQQASALILASFYEGMPNVVCEAMASGLPVLMSDVGDARELVIDGKDGFVFDSNADDDIAAKIGDFVRLPVAEKRSLGEFSRMRAVEMFGEERFVGQFADLLEAASERL